MLSKGDNMRVYDVNEGATRYVFPLSPKKIIKKTVGASLIWIVCWIMCTFIIVIWSVLWFFILTVVPIPVVIIGIYAYEKLYFKTYYYDVKPDVLIIRKGVWMPKEIRLPYAKIQNVYVDRDFLDVVFKLYDVHLATADLSSAFYAHIDGIEEENAIGVRELILGQVKKDTKPGDDGT